jgi:hypothetical protein
MLGLRTAVRWWPVGVEDRHRDGYRNVTPIKPQAVVVGRRRDRHLRDLLTGGQPRAACQSTIGGIDRSLAEILSGAAEFARCV